MFAAAAAVLSFSSALLIAGIFAHAGASKLARNNRAYYESVIREYAVTPVDWSAPVVVAIGILELCTATLALVPYTRSAGMLVAATLLTGYALVFLKLIYEGKRDMDCGCAGPGGKVKVGPGLVIRNTVLISLALFAAIYTFEVSGTLLLLGIPLLLTFALIYLSTEHLAANAQKIQALRTSGL